MSEASSGNSGLPRDPRAILALTPEQLIAACGPIVQLTEESGEYKPPDTPERAVMQMQATQDAYEPVWEPDTHVKQHVVRGSHMEKTFNSLNKLLKTVALASHYVLLNLTQKQEVPPDILNLFKLLPRVEPAKGLSKPDCKCYACVIIRRLEFVESKLEPLEDDNPTLSSSTGNLPELKEITTELFGDVKELSSAEIFQFLDEQDIPTHKPLEVPLKAVLYKLVRNGFNRDLKQLPPNTYVYKVSQSNSEPYYYKLPFPGALGHRYVKFGPELVAAYQITLIHNENGVDKVLREEKIASPELQETSYNHSGTATLSFGNEQTINHLTVITDKSNKEFVETALNCFSDFELLIDKLPETAKKIKILIRIRTIPDPDDTEQPC